MKKEILHGLLCVSLFFFICITHTAAQKPWTFLVYMAAVNDLHQFAQLDLQEMMKIGSNDNINILVYLMIQEENKTKVTKKLYVEPGALVQIGETTARDSGDVVSLEEALMWACKDYPSDHIAVVLWGEGSGSLNRFQTHGLSKGVCYDHDAGYYLTDCDCLQAFSWGRDFVRNGKKFDVIIFDASFLASLEIAYTLSSCADYMVAPQDDFFDVGYQYADVLYQCATQRIDSSSLALYMMNASHSFSVVDLTALQPLVDNCNAVAHILSSQLMSKHRKVVKATLKKCINIHNCPSFNEDMYIDLCQFYKNLLQHSAGLHISKSYVNQFKRLLNDGIQLFSHIIKGHGISIYFSRYMIDPSYYGLYWTQQNPSWLQFLEAFIS
jgi:hypothetical protein